MHSRNSRSSKRQRAWWAAALACSALIALSSLPAAASEDEPSAEPTPSSSPASPTDPGTPTAAPTPTTAATTTASATTTAKRTPRSDPIQAQVVPPATGNNAVITVKVGGDRTGTSGVSGLAGVVLGLYANSTGGSAVFTCTSDADGDCNFTVPDTQVGGTNHDRRFWVRQVSSPAGTYNSTDLGTATNNGSAASTAYRFQTGTSLTNGQTYSSTTDFMIGTGAAVTTSGGIWQNSRNNPSIPAQCGINVALVLDVSGSV